VNQDGTVTLLKDEVFDLEKGDRHIAYISIRDRIHDRLLHGVDKVVLKASSGGRFTGTQAALLSAELRGVFIAAVPRSVTLMQEHAKTLSKAGSRKISEYIKDEAWWNQKFSGKIRKTNREAAYLILSAE
jgi:hypothetical protein